MTPSFLLEEKAGSKEISFRPRGIIFCGYTGRNQEAVRRHIDELEQEGVSPPPSVPAYFPRPPQGLTLEPEIWVEGRETSGEIEFALLVHPSGFWVGLGSDHTDRELEKLSVPKSKQICPVPISGTLWNYEEIKEHWDVIQIRSWVTAGPARRLYQESTLATILPPEKLVSLVRPKVKGSMDGMILYSGTPPLLEEGFVFADRFEGELYDPVLDRRIPLSYFIHPLDWFVNESLPSEDL